MSYETPGAGALDYFPCRYGGSRLLLRGPWRAPERGYVVAMGGSVTYGRFVAEPWPELLEAATGRMVLNLGVCHAGPDAYIHDRPLLDLARGATLRLLQLPGAINLANPLYTVHPRRNDRFIAASAQLRRLYPDIDFMDFAFTRHMIGALAHRDPRRFAEVARILADSWLDRMGTLLQALAGPTVLLRYAAHPAPRPGSPVHLAPEGPVLVDARMIQVLRAHAAGFAEVLVADFAGPLTGKVYAPLEQLAAGQLPGPAEHAAIAHALLPHVVRLAA